MKPKRGRGVCTELQIPFFPLLLSDDAFVVLMLFHLRFFRVNGFKKQTEILRQKHAEFKEKYKRTDVGDDK